MCETARSSPATLEAEHLYSPVCDVCGLAKSNVPLRSTLTPSATDNRCPFTVQVMVGFGTPVTGHLTVRGVLLRVVIFSPIMRNLGLLLSNGISRGKSGLLICGFTGSETQQSLH